MIVILKYNAGNTSSVKHAIERLGYACKISDDKTELKQASKVIIPGVGEAGSAMNYLKEKKLDVLIKELTQPVLGICLGLQLMCRYSEEGDTECLGIFDAIVKKFPPLEKVPHMGWNTLKNRTGNLYKDMISDENVYFVHSYYAGLCAQTTAVCNYIIPFSAGMQTNNFYATQFHPEKSASVGEHLLKNFLSL